MNVAELDPRIVTTRTFSLRCPVCGHHRISVPIADGQWRWDGSTLEPSIQFEGGFLDEKGGSIECKGHFTITNGVVTLC